MKRHANAPRKLSVNLETLRTLTILELEMAFGGGTDAAPAQSRSSTAGSCQTTRFACC